MKRVIYVCYMNLGISGSMGIREKILNHIHTFEQYGYEMCYIYIENGKIISNLGFQTIQEKTARNNIVLINEMFCNVDIKQGDIIYIRYQHFNKSFLSTVKYLHQMGAYILLEIPTYPFVGEYKSYVVSALRKHKYKDVVSNYINILRYYYYSPKMNKCIDRIITYSDDSKIWNIQTIKCSNGIDTLSIAYSNRSDNSGINFICVSSCAYWHGYDRFIKGMIDYYNGDYSEEVYLHIVGDGPVLPEYKQLVKDYSLEKYVKFYGNLRGEKLDFIYKKADIALDAMGRHRVGVFYNSSLKGKEYAARGLPIISGVKTEFDNYIDCPFYYRVPADESNINIKDVLDFYFKISSVREYEKVIRAYAEKNFDYKETMKPIKEFIDNIDS